MSAFECLKCKIHFRGDVSMKEQSFDYIGGDSKDMLMDPDLMTWSIFGEFCKENEVDGEVEEVWYKLPHEDISSARSIGNDKDGGIRELCREAIIGGEVDIYIDNGVTVPAPFPLSNEDVVDEEDGVEADADEDDHGDRVEEDRHDDGVDPEEEGKHDDPQFFAFFEEINNGRPHGDEATVGDEAAVGNEAAGVNEARCVDEDEFERQCFDADLISSF